MRLGLPVPSRVEMRDRVRAAATSVGLRWESHDVVFGASPDFAAQPHHDLAAMAAFAQAEGWIPRGCADGMVFLGELGLDGTVRHTSGVVPAVAAARKAGFDRVVVPLDQMAEAYLVPGVEVVGVRDVKDLFERLSSPASPSVGAGPGLPSVVDHGFWRVSSYGLPDHLVAAVTVAAAGQHHMLVQHPNGMVPDAAARLLAQVLPDMDQQTALQHAMFESLLGKRLRQRDLDRRPPLLKADPKGYLVAMVGSLEHPGLMSLAHGGVLFLPEAPGFPDRVLDRFRVPMESGRVTAANTSGGATVWPAAFQLVVGAAGCPCGQPDGCSCPPQQLRRYGNRIPGAMLDRLDIQLRDGRPVVDWLEFVGTVGELRSFVDEARDRQLDRLGHLDVETNAKVPTLDLRRMTRRAEPIEDAVARGVLSPRGADKVLRLAWTVADLSGHEQPDLDDLEVAFGLRGTPHSFRLTEESAPVSRPGRDPDVSLERSAGVGVLGPRDEDLAAARPSSPPVGI
ncbi:MAG: ATP-binding protein [Propionibacteriaceae bacterium]|nr:ATP-binding protein [Propionibacteriaceae bacterium]